jgi:hypothetical protein
MRLRRFLITIALAIALVAGPAAYGDLKYRAEITGTEDSEFADLLDSVSELKALEDKPPASEEALRRRADRDLQRLADAAHSLGYWDAEFSYEVDTEAEPAKVTVTVKPGPLYHVASIKVVGPGGQPLSIPQDEKKLPLKPGDGQSPGRDRPRHPDDGGDLHARPRTGNAFRRTRDRGARAA